MGNAIATEESVGALVKQLGNGPFTGLGIGIVTQYARHGQKVVGMDGVLRGPPMPLEVPKKTLGKWIYESLKKQPPNFVILIEADTEREITSSQLLLACSKLGLALRKYGVTKGDTVAIIGDNTIDTAIAGIACLLIGAYMAPIDPLLKSLEHQHIFKILGPKLVICDAVIVKEVKDALDKIHSEAFILTTQPLEGFDYMSFVIESVDDEAAAEFEPADGHERETAIIVCSSGTSGMPKGVALSHYAFCYQVTLFASNWLKGYCLHTAYFYWISGVLVLMGTTINGVARILVKSLDPVAVMAAVDKYQPVIGLLVPAFLSKIVQHPRLPEFNMSSLKALTVGGAPTTKTLLDKVHEKLPGLIIAQGYGASEVAGLVSHAKPPIDVLSLGKVVPDCEVKIIDRSTGQVLGVEEEGEILCRSPAMMNGYVGNKKATDEAIDEDGWYHTGDIGKYTSEGVLYMTGRAKELIKIGGHQMSPEELEGLISGMDGVVDVVVTGVTNGDDQLPMALVVLKEDAQISEDDIHNLIKENLSDFKQLRAGVRFVDNFPRTSTGKIKRRDVQELAEALKAEYRE